MTVIPNYQVKFRDHAGELQALYAGSEESPGGLVSVVYEEIENGIYNHAITVRGDISFADELERDWIVEVIRRPLGASDFVEGYIGFHRVTRREADGEGVESFTSMGYGLNHLLKRRIITESPVASSGPAETAAQQFVDNNAGPSATTVTDSITSVVYDRSFPGFELEIDQGRGGTWSGDRTNLNLLGVVKEIADAAGQYFNIVKLSSTTYQFRWYELLGQDKTIDNGAIAPVVFSLERNNLLVPVSVEDYSNEVTMVYLLGRESGGSQVARQVGAAGTIINASPYNLIEVFRPAPTDVGGTEIEYYGLAELDDGEAKTSMQFTAQQTLNSAYGKHYVMGDLVTVFYHKRYDLRIVKARIEANERGEYITIAVDEAIRTRQNNVERVVDRLSSRLRRLESVAK